MHTDAEGAVADGGGDGFEAYARSGQRRLYRTAYPLCADAEAARDLTQTPSAKLFRYGHRAGAAGHVDAYASTVPVRTSGTRERLTCGPVSLADGTVARAYRQPVDSPARGEVSLRLAVGSSDVFLTVSPPEPTRPATTPQSSAASAPPTLPQLISAVDDTRLQEPVSYADAHPVLKSGTNSAD
ncbi:hypothetical protein AB0G71_03015 [Streptomyces sp. NPDC020403]|uniref:hypothetical protein n=1 Tax=unclassified Streptomyces TaxID=2593676 RepID=UPI0033D2A79C